MKPQWEENGGLANRARQPGVPGFAASPGGGAERRRLPFFLGLVLLLGAGVVSSTCRKDSSGPEEAPAPTETGAALDAAAEAARQYQKPAPPGETAQAASSVPPAGADADAQRQAMQVLPVEDTPDAQLPIQGGEGPVLSHKRALPGRSDPTKQVPETPPPDLAPPEYPTLIDAVKAGDIADVENHILRGEDLNAQAENGFTALHFAARAGQVEILKLLLDYGADFSICAKQEGFSSPLVTAEEAEQWEAAALLRSRGAFYTVFLLAMWGDVRGMEELAGARPGALKEKTLIGETSLHWAARFGKTKVVEFLLDQGLDPDLPEKERGSTPFTEAALHNRAGVVKLMVARGADVDQRLFYGNTVLHKKAETGDLELVELLLSLGADINAKNAKGWTPLHTAVAARQQEFAEFLIKKGALIYAADHKGLSPLHLAAQRELVDMITFLMERGASVTRKDRYGRTPLHVAALEGRNEAVALLIERGAEVNARDKRDQTPLHLVTQGTMPMGITVQPKGGRRPIGGTYTFNIEVADGVAPYHYQWYKTAPGGRPGAMGIPVGDDSSVLTLGSLTAGDQGTYSCVVTDADWTVVTSAGAELRVFTPGAEPELKSASASRPDTPGLATVEKRLAVVELLLGRGAKLEAQNKYGETPLHTAAGVRRRPIIELLLDRGAQIEARENNGRTPLFNAIENQHVDVVRLLIQRGANINVKDMLSRLPLHEAAKASRGDIAKLLLEQGTAAAAADANGQTPLHFVAQRGCVATGELLIVYGADVDAPDVVGRTPLYLAAQRGDVRLVKLFLANGANPGQRDRHGRTPLHAAAWEGNWGPVQLLIGDKVDINAQDSNGFTALHVAAEAGHDRMVKLLLERGADPLILNNDRFSALHLADARGREKVMAALQPFAEEAFREALETGDSEKAKSLLDDYPPLAKAAIHRMTPLHLAARKGNKAIVELLLARGANVAAMGGAFYKRTPLHDAAANGHRDVARLLLLMGADPNAKDSRGRTPLDQARLKRREKIAEMLMEKGGQTTLAEAELQALREGKVETEHTAALRAAAEAALDTGQPPESQAEMKGYLRSLTHNELLVAIVLNNRGRVKEILDENPLLVNADFLGTSALYLAVNKGKKDIVKLLLDHGADIEAHSKKTSGRTPLHEAVRHGHRDIAKILLDHGANAFAQDKSGKTPLDIARGENHPEIGKLLQDYMGIQ